MALQESRAFFDSQKFRLKGAGGLHQNFLKIDFLVVSNGGEWYLSAAISTIEK